LGLGIISSNTINTKAAPGGTQNAVAVAQGVPTLSTLVTAITAAGLAPTLSSSAAPGPFTIFAPNDAAFVALPANALNALLLPSNSTLLHFRVIPLQYLQLVQEMLL